MTFSLIRVCTQLHQISEKGHGVARLINEDATDAR